MKLQKILILSTLVVGCALSNLATAQGPPHEGGRHGGGGPRGMMGGDPVIGMLRIEEVRNEVKITPEQAEAIKKIAESNRPERPDMSNFRNLKEEERQELFKKMQEKRETAHAAIREQLEEVLLPGQLERLSQLSIQQQGARALASSEVVEKLGITDEQKKQLVEVRGKVQKLMRERMQEIFSSGDREGIREKMAEIRTEMEEEVMGVLTSEQRTKFDALKGEAFDMPKPDWRGRGGREGGPRDGERRRRGGRRDGKRNQSDKAPASSPQ